MTWRRLVLLALAGTAAVLLGSAWLAQGDRTAPTEQSAPQEEDGLLPPHRPRIGERPSDAHTVVAAAIVCPPHDFVVVADEGRKPIAGARLVLREEGRLGDVAVTTTDAAGRARFEQVPASFLVVQASATGYCPSLIRFRGEEQSETAEIALWPGVRAFGRVLAAVTERPIAGARVLSASVLHGRMSSPPSSADIDGEFATDEAGRFDIPGAPTEESRLIVWVLAPGYLPAVQVRYASAAETDFGIFRLERGTSIKLRLELPDGTPAAGAFVSIPFLRTFLEGDLRGWSDGLAYSARADSDGRVDFPHAAPGITYRLRAFIPGSEMRLEDAQVTAPRTDESPVTVLRLEAPVADASLEVRPIDGAGQPVTQFAWITVECAGRREVSTESPYVIERLPRGRCTVHVAVQHSPTWKGEVELDGPVRRIVEVKLGGAGRVSGRVVDDEGSPITGAVVTLADEAHGSSPTPFRGTQSDETGAFALDDLPIAQSYALFARADGYVQRRLVVRTPASDVAVSLDEFALITAKLRSPAGAPPPRLVPIHIYGERYYAFFADGRLEYHYLRPGRTSFVLGWDGVLSRSFDVEAKGRAVVDLGDVTFEASRTGQGVVADARGSPAKFARVTIAGPQAETRCNADDAGRFLAEGLDGGPHRVVVWNWRGDEGFCGEVSFPESGAACIALRRAGLVRFDVGGDPDRVAACRFLIVPAADPTAAHGGWSSAAGGPPDYRGVFRARVLPGSWVARLQDDDGNQLGQASFEVGAEPEGEMRVPVSVK